MTLIMKIYFEIWFVFFSQDQHLFLNLFVTLNKSDQKMSEFLFLCITQPEKIRETKKFFDWILLLPNALLSMAAFLIRMIFFLEKKVLDFISS